MPRDGHGVRWLCECSCENHTRIIVPARQLLTHSRLSCGCESFSYGEMCIKILLEENNIPYETQKIFKECSFPDTHYHPRWDFFVNNKYIIEFDGLQHYRPWSFHSKISSRKIHEMIEDFQKLKNHDIYKTNWCLANKIPLIRIPYTHLKKLKIEDLVLETSEFVVKDRIIMNYNFFNIPTICPSCGHLLEERRTVRSLLGVDVVTLHCTNPLCPAQLLAYLTHFVSRPAMNINGLSEATLELLIDNGYLHNACDIFYLSKVKSSIEKLPGMGKKSVEKLLANIEKARNVTMENFIVALGIPQIGKSAAKILAKKYKGNMELLTADIALNDRAHWSADTFGPSMTDSLYDWFEDEDNFNFFRELIHEVNILIPEDKPVQVDENDFFAGKTFCVTGAFETLKRSEIEKIITDRGGKLTGSVSKSTSILLTNDANSGSSKAKKARELGTPIMSEAEFLEKIGGSFQ